MVNTKIQGLKSTKTLCRLKKFPLNIPYAKIYFPICMPRKDMMCCKMAGVRVYLSRRQTASSMINVPKTSYTNDTEMSRASVQMCVHKEHGVLSSIGGGTV